MRLFIGIPLHTTLQQQITKKMIPYTQMEGFRFGKPENYHITLLFLGETEIKPEILSESLQEVANHFSTFEFSLHQLIGFPSNHKATSMGLTVLPKDPFLHLRESILVHLSNYGFRPGKPMIPHVTISRMKHPANILSLQKKWEYSSIAQTAEMFVLYQSVLQPAGPIYHPLHILKLKGESHG